MVSVRGRRLRIWRREGQPGTPPLLLCNGIGVSLDHIAPFAAALDPAIGVVAFDVPGIGQLPAAEASVPVQRPRPARRPAPAAARPRPVRRPGHLLGGGLAQQIALQNPRRCRRVVLVSTGTGALMVPARPSVLLRMATPRRHRDRAYLPAVAGQIYGGRIRSHPELVTSSSPAVPTPSHDRGTCTKCWAGSAGPACRCDRCSGSPPSSSPATTTRSSPRQRLPHDKAAATLPPAHLPRRPPRTDHQRRRAHSCHRSIFSTGIAKPQGTVCAAGPDDDVRATTIRQPPQPA